MESCYKKAGYIQLIVEVEDIALMKYGKKSKYPKRWPWLDYD